MYNFVLIALSIYRFVIVGKWWTSKNEKKKNKKKNK